ncbi:hypothetical protein [Psychroserpens sp. MEBiC05023]
MKLKLNRILFIGVFAQLMSTQGVLLFNVFKALGNWEIKSIVHPLSFFMIIGTFIIFTIKRIKITKIDIIAFIYFFLMFLILLYNADGPSSVYLGFREVLMIFVLTFIYNQMSLTNKQWAILLKLLFYLVILNLFFVFLTYYLGPEDYMKLITGKYKWGVDDEYKFQISVFLSRFWRSPGLVGSSGALSYFALFTYILMDDVKKYRYKKFLAFLLLFVTFTRSALLGFVIYFALRFLLNKENIKRMAFISKYLLILIIVALIILNYYGILDIQSILIRIDIWFNSIDVDYNFIYGGAIGDSGSAVRGEGAVAILDSYWLLMLYSTGIVGICMWGLFFYEKGMRSQKLIIITVAIFISGLFITLTQAIPFLVMFPLLYLRKYEDFKKTI